MEVNHKYGDKHNNHPDNLERVTPSETGLHACRVLGRNRGEKHGAANLRAADVREIRRLCEQGVTRKRIAEKLEIDPGNVTKVAQRVGWKHVNNRGETETAALPD
jgi:DNA invertase Pin-like site-specific DNA recombinase